MNTTLVTAIYYGDRQGKYGGRSWQEQYYFASLQNVLNFNLPTVIFTSTEGKMKVTKYIEYLKKLNVKIDCTIIEKSLDDLKHREIVYNHRHKVIDYKVNQIKKEKEEHPEREVPNFFHARCELLCHNKIYFLKEISELNPFNTDNFCWVDAGITHWGLTPFSKGGTEVNNLFDIRHYYPYNKNNIFTPEIGIGINNIISNHGMFTCNHFNPWYSPMLWNQLCELLLNEYKIKDFRFNEQIIGGIIGLQYNEIDNLINFYEKGLKKLCSYDPPNTEFFTEEIILTSYHKIRKYFLVSFHDWPHTSEGDPCCAKYGDNDLERRKKRIQFHQVFENLKTY